MNQQVGTDMFDQNVTNIKSDSINQSFGNNMFDQNVTNIRSESKNQQVGTELIDQNDNFSLDSFKPNKVNVIDRTISFSDENNELIQPNITLEKPLLRNLSDFANNSSKNSLRSNESTKKFGQRMRIEGEQAGGIGRQLTVSPGYKEAAKNQSRENSNDSTVEFSN